MRVKQLFTSFKKTTGRVVFEAFIIVVSILLAFGIDAWWQEHQDLADVQESLTVLRRDLVDAVYQLEEYQQFSSESAKVSLAAVKALSNIQTITTEQRAEVEKNLIRSTYRRTVRLPRAGYTDLLTTGNLGKIENRVLRDQIVQYHEAAERDEQIVEKNSSLFTDDILKEALISTGLIIPYPRNNMGLALQQKRDVKLVEYMGDEFVQLPNRIWQIEPNSEQVNVIIAALFQNARGSVTGELISEATAERALALIDNIDSYLETVNK